MTPIELNYTEKLTKSVVREYWLIQIGPFYITLLVTLTVFFIYLIANGDRTWFVGLIGAVVIIGAAFLLTSYLVQLKRSLYCLKRMGAPKATFEYTDKYFKVSSDIGSSEFQWKVIKKVLCFKSA